MLTTPVFAAVTECTGPQSNSAVFTTKLDVPVGYTCTLYGGEVQGNVTVEGSLVSFSTLYDKNVSVLGGSIEIVNGNGTGSQITGNLTIIGSASSGIYCPNSSNIIGGDLTVLNSSFYVCSATVNGDVVLSDNTGSSQINNLTGGANVTVAYNAAPITLTGVSATDNMTVNDNAQVTLGTDSAGRDLTCNGNTIITGGDDTAGKAIIGQCASLP
jgi:hypothetical protein